MIPSYCRLVLLRAPPWHLHSLLHPSTNHSRSADISWWHLILDAQLSLLQPGQHGTVPVPWADRGCLTWQFSSPFRNYSKIPSCYLHFLNFVAPKVDTLTDKLTDTLTDITGNCINIIHFSFQERKFAPLQGC